MANRTASDYIIPALAIGLSIAGFAWAKQRATASKELGNFRSAEDAEGLSSLIASPRNGRGLVVVAGISWDAARALADQNADLDFVWTTHFAAKEALGDDEIVTFGDFDPSRPWLFYATIPATGPQAGKLLYGEPANISDGANIVEALESARGLPSVR